jgi:hypothetical protein
MSSRQFETFLARLYTDREYREAFLEAPEQVIQRAGLEEQERQAAFAIDRAGLRMAARSYELKRAGRKSRRLRLPWRAA